MFATILTFFAPVLLKGKTFFLKNKYPVIVTVLALFLLWFNFIEIGTIKRKNKEIAVANQNLSASLDTIRLTKDKAGKDEADKLSFLVTKVSDLQKINSNLAQQVKETKGTVSQISDIGFKIDQKQPVKLETKSEVTDSTIKANFAFDTSYTPGNSRSLRGYTTYNLKTGFTTGELNKDIINVHLITGIKNLDINKPEIFVRSDYPGFNVTALEGAVIDPKLFKKETPKVPLFTFGATFGFTPITYDWSSHNLDFNFHRVGATVGVNINLIRLFKK